MKVLWLTLAFTAIIESTNGAVVFNRTADVIYNCAVALDPLVCIRECVAMQKVLAISENSAKQIAQSVCDCLEPSMVCVKQIQVQCAPFISQNIEGVLEYTKEICTPGKSQDLYIENIKCIANVQQSADMQSCFAEAERYKMTSSDDSRPDKELSEEICCHLQKKIECVDQYYGSKCGKDVESMEVKISKLIVGPVVREYCLNANGDFRCDINSIND